MKRNPGEIALIPIFISVHDQDLILKLEKNNIFRYISGYKYLFLGFRPTDKLASLKDKVVIARDLPNNIEHDKCLFDYPGWYALIKNNLIRNSHVIIVHYDCLLYRHFMRDIINAFKENKDYFINFQPHLLTCDYFISDKYAKTAIEIMNTDFNIDIRAKINDAIAKGDKYWPGGGSFACSKEWLEKYVDWIELFHTKLLNDPMASHNIERTMKFYNLIFNVKEKYLPTVMKHIYNSAHDQKYESDEVVQIRHRDFESFIRGDMFNTLHADKCNKRYIKLLKYKIEQFLLKF